MEKFSLIYFLLLFQLTMFPSIYASPFGYFHCRAATCHDFHHGLKSFGDPKDYVNVCYETIHSLQNVSQTYGKCFNEMTREFNRSCIYDLAKTIKSCVEKLNDVPLQYARYYCGHRLMQNCARHVGLERFPYKDNYRHPQ